LKHDLTSEDYAACFCQSLTLHTEETVSFMVMKNDNSISCSKSWYLLWHMPLGSKESLSKIHPTCYDSVSSHITPHSTGSSPIVFIGCDAKWCSSVPQTGKGPKSEELFKFKRLYKVRETYCSENVMEAHGKTTGIIVYSLGGMTW